MLSAIAAVLATVTSQTASAAMGQACTNASFPVSFDGLQIAGLTGAPAAASLASCRQACCSAGKACEVYEWSETPSKSPNCWVGKVGQILGKGPYSSRGTVAAPCPAFTQNYTGFQIGGLTQDTDPAAQSAAGCEKACCLHPGCQVWQYSPSTQCWIGPYSTPVGTGNFISFASASSPPAPRPAPPPPAGPYTVDDTPGLGMRWEGVGAISGGGATTKLLMDYDPAVVSDILDFMFTPGFGLDLDILKVEMGGDTDSTEGAEPSHMHGGPGDENYNRGYEWWLMKEAKKRNPALKLYGLPWGWPGWLDPAATADKQATNAFADPKITANYTLAWLLGAKREHGLDIDFMGQWNERDAPEAYNDALRAAVAGSSLAGTTTVLNRLPHYPGTGVNNDPQGCKTQQWNSTDGRNWVDEEGSIFDGRSARCLARCINRGYVTGCHTATFQWHLISSFYDFLPWSRCGVAVANQPWSGAYEITSPTWAIAHTTQFADPGWRYAAHGSGTTMLGGGGSMVTRVSPDLSDFSVVIEKMTTVNSVCARGNNPDITVAAEKVVLVLKGKLLAAAKAKGLHVWRSNLTSANDEGVNPVDDQVFQKLSSQIPVGADGAVSIEVNPEEMFTITTIAGGQKGKHASQAKAKAPFPLPFTQDFDGEAVSAPPALWYDQMGAWEVQKDPSSAGGNLMRQVSPVWPACWGYSCSGPLTYFGPQTFNASDNVAVGIDVVLEEHGTWSLYGKTSSGTICGVALGTNGTGSVFCGGNKMTAAVVFAVGKVHTVQLAFGPTGVKVALDSQAVGEASSGHVDGMSIVMGLDRYIYASVDNFRIIKVHDLATSPTMTDRGAL